MKLIQIGNCCSWKTADGRYQIDYWTNRNRPWRKNGTSGGYGMYTLLDLQTWNTIGSFTSKRAAIAAVAGPEGRDD